MLDQEVKTILQELPGQRLVQIGLKKIVPYDALGCAEIQRLEDEPFRNRAFAEFKQRWFGKKNVAIEDVRMGRSTDGYVCISYYRKYTLFGFEWTGFDMQYWWLSHVNIKECVVREEMLSAYAEEKIPNEVLACIVEMQALRFTVEQMRVLWPVMEEVKLKDPIVAVKLGDDYYEIARW